MNLRHLSLLTIVLVTLPVTPHAWAATICSNLQNLAIPTNFAGVYLDLDTGATASSAFTGWDINPFFGGAGLGNSAAFQPVRVGTSNLDAVLNLTSGTAISGELDLLDLLLRLWRLG